MVHLNLSNMKIITALLLVICVTSEKEKNTEAKDIASAAERLPLIHRK